MCPCRLPVRGSSWCRWCEESGRQTNGAAPVAGDAMAAEVLGLAVRTSSTAGALKLVRTGMHGIMYSSVELFILPLQVSCHI